MYCWGDGWHVDDVKDSVVSRLPPFLPKIHLIGLLQRTGRKKKWRIEGGTQARPPLRVLILSF